MASALLSLGVMAAEDPRTVTKTCTRCGGRAIYQPDAIVPGNPIAPRGSRQAEAHPQPAWQCMSCGYLEPQERRASRISQRQDT